MLVIIKDEAVDGMSVTFEHSVRDFADTDWAIEAKDLTDGACTSLNKLLSANENSLDPLEFSEFDGKPMINWATVNSDSDLVMRLYNPNILETAMPGDLHPVQISVVYK